MRPARAALAAVAAPLAIVVSGCDSTTLDEDALEGQIAAELERRTAERPSVDCPADAAAAAGTTFRCRLRLADGSPSAVRVTVLSDDGDVRFDLLPPGAVGAPTAEEQVP